MSDEQPAFAQPTTSAPYDDPQGFRRRRRWVRDGEVMVERAQLRADLPRPNTARLPEIEAALRDAQARHGRQERLLEETKATITSLRTQLGHAEIALREAQQVAAAERAKAVAAQAALLDLEAQLQAARAQAEIATTASRPAPDVAAIAAFGDEVRGDAVRGNDSVQAADVPAVVPERRKPGRPRKVPLVVDIPAETAAAAPERRKPGRPRKVPLAVDIPADATAAAPERRKPGRPRKWVPSSELARHTTPARHPARPSTPGTEDPQPQSEPVRWWEESWRERF